MGLEQIQPPNTFLVIGLFSPNDWQYKPLGILIKALFALVASPSDGYQQEVYKRFLFSFILSYTSVLYISSSYNLLRHHRCRRRCVVYFDAYKVLPQHVVPFSQKDRDLSDHFLISPFSSKILLQISLSALSISFV